MIKTELGNIVSEEEHKAAMDKMRMERLAELKGKKSKPKPKRQTKRKAEPAPEPEATPEYDNEF